MALSTAIFVGDTKEWIPEIVEKAKKLQVNAGKKACFSRIHLNETQNKEF